VIVTPWDNEREVVILELGQREFEGARVPERLRRQILALREADEINGDDLERLSDELAALEADPAFPYIQPNDLEGIRRERPVGPRRLSLGLSDDELLDRFHGAWTGRACGCALGQPVEIWGTVAGKGRELIRSYLQARGEWPLVDYFSGTDAGTGLKLPAVREGQSLRENIAYMGPDDDIHYSLIALHVLETAGPEFAWHDVADAWGSLLPMHAFCTAEGVALLNYAAATPRYANSVPKLREYFSGQLDGTEIAGSSTRAIRPDPAWTRTRGNPYREWIGAQIRADGWGYAAAGNPQLAAEYAWRDASWTHTANGTYGEMFYAAVIAAAFVERDPIRLIEIGLSEIPRHCRLAEAIVNIEDWFKECDSFEQFMDRLDAAFADLHPVHTINNALVVLAALYYCNMQPHEMICTAVMGGLDSDCNGATAGSIVGAATGRSRFDSRLVGPLNDTIRSHVLGFAEITMRELAERQLGVYKDVERYADRRG
jgi:ADP-ribosylglycohydrolase